MTEVQALSHRMLFSSSSGVSSQRLLSVCSTRPGWRREHQPTPRGKNRPNRHRDPWWSKLRGAKVLKVDVPDYEFQRRAALGKASPAEVRDELKKLGTAPLRERYSEKPLYVSCTGGVLDDYVPPEGDGKASVVSTEVSISVWITLIMKNNYHCEIDLLSWLLIFFLKKSSWYPGKWQKLYL